MAEYTPAGKEDFIIVVAGNDPLPKIIIAASVRAKELFKLWGVEEETTGIHPPDDPRDFINSIPLNWKVASAEVEDGGHYVQEVPLPRPRLVLH